MRSVHPACLTTAGGLATTGIGCILSARSVDWSSHYATRPDGVRDWVGDASGAQALRLTGDGLIVLGLALVFLAAAFWLRETCRPPA